MERDVPKLQDAGTNEAREKQNDKSYPECKAETKAG
jgi:hypothetical protein